MAQRPDDPTVPNDAALWRGVLPSWIHPDGSRPQSLTFIDGSDAQEVSFFIASETTKECLMENGPFVKLAQVTAGFLRSLGYSVARDPEGADGDAAHVVACPANGKTRKDIEKDARRIAKQATWVP